MALVPTFLAYWQSGRNYVKGGRCCDPKLARLQDEKLRLHCPQSLSDVTTLLRRYGTKARLLAGGTDLLLRLERRLVEPIVVIDLK